MLSKKLFGLLAGLMCLAATFGAQAQNLTVRGTVADAAGPVVGAVVLSGNANAVTDMDGAYTINVPSNAVLEVSCLGYVTQQVPVNGRSSINVGISVICMTAIVGCSLATNKLTTICEHITSTCYLFRGPSITNIDGLGAHNHLIDR